MQRIIALLLAFLAIAVSSPLVELELNNSSRQIAEDVLEVARGLSDMKELLEEWEMWKQKHTKTYQDAFEELHRLKIWTDNVKYIQKHNANPIHSHKLGTNQFADLTQSEYADRYLRHYPSSSSSRTGSIYLEPLNLLLPKIVDWKDEGYVTAVKNQSSCGSCWAFSTTGSLEGQHYRKTRKLVSLSEQNLMDCSGSYGNKGCNGGMMDNAFAYIRANGGIDTEEAYPYNAEQGACKYSSAESGATLSSWVDIQSGNETQLCVAVASEGPISVAIDANHSSFQLYKSGVYSDTECSSTQLDHGVLVVGYGVEEGKEYWLVKNSWGDSWGEEGYIKMSRGEDNQCGIATSASYPVV